MKNLLLAFLLLSISGAFAQQQDWYVEKADGTKLQITSVTINYQSKKVKFRVQGDAKDSKAKYKALKSLSYAGYWFRIFKIKNHYAGFYIKSESAEKYLCFHKYIRIANKGGGFESTFEHVDFAVIDKQGNLLDRFDLRETNNAANLEIREKAAASIRAHFSDCPVLLKEFDEYYTRNEKDRSGILDFFKRRESVVSCK